MDQESQSANTIEFDDDGFIRLIKKVGEGDEEAFTTLYDTTSHLIYGIVSRIVSEKTVAEETLLDIYTYIWKDAACYDPKSLMPLEWLITIARTRSILKHASNKESKKPALVESETASSPATVAPSIQTQVRSWMDSLTASQKEALDWAFYTGLSFKEIAVQRGKPLGAVRTHTRIALSKLYDLFRPLYGRETGPETVKGGEDFDPRKTD